MTLFGQSWACPTFKASPHRRRAKSFKSPFPTLSVASLCSPLCYFVGHDAPQRVFTKSAEKCGKWPIIDEKWMFTVTPTKCDIIGTANISLWRGSSRPLCNVPLFLRGNSANKGGGRIPSSNYVIWLSPIPITHLDPPWWRSSQVSPSCKIAKMCSSKITI